MHVGAWFSENLRIYGSNAVSERDRRGQLRGRGVAWLWLLYVGLLAMVALIAYSEARSMGITSVTRAQASLRGLYEGTITLLAVVVSLLAPIFTSSAIVIERQRQSLDLIAKAPVPIKYYLVGKMISSFRYSWMLLALALPFSAIGVALGGATWSDVLWAYLNLTGIAMVFTAFGLLVSSMSPNVPTGLTITLIGVVGYLIVSAIAASAAFGGIGGAAGSNEMLFSVGLNPFFSAMVASTVTVIYGVSVPNVLLCFAVALLLARFFLLAAGSALSRYDSPETKSFRYQSLLYMGALGAGVGGWMQVFPVAALTGGPGSGSFTSPTHPMNALIWPITVLLFFMPWIACYSPIGLRKFLDDGCFSLRGIGLGSPGGGLPYWLLLTVAYFGSALAVYAQAGGGTLPSPFVAGLVYFLALSACFWALCRWISRGVRDIRSSRVLAFLLIAMVLIIGPSVIASFDAGMLIRDPGWTRIFNLYPTSPLHSTTMDGVWPFTAILGALALLVLMLERRPRKVKA